MSQHHTISGRRSGLAWLAVLLGLGLVAMVIVIATIIVPEQTERRALMRATVEADAWRAAVTATAHAETTEVERQYQAGMAFQSAGRWDDAITALTEVIRRAPGHKDASDRLAQVSQARVAAGASANATATAQVQVDRGNRATATAQALEAHYQKGLGCITLKRWVEAKSELEQVFVIDPNHKDVQAQLALINAEVARLAPSPTPTPWATPTPIITSTPTVHAYDPSSAPSSTPIPTRRPTETPVPPPTLVPDTQPDTILEVGQTWRQGKMELVLVQANLRAGLSDRGKIGGWYTDDEYWPEGIERGGVDIMFLLTSRKSQAVAVRYTLKSVSATDNLGNQLIVFCWGNEGFPDSWYHGAVPCRTFDKMLSPGQTIELLGLNRQCHISSNSGLMA